MHDIESFGDGGRSGSLMRSIRIGASLLGTGFVAGVLVGIFAITLIKTVLILAAVVIVAVALLRMSLGRRRN